MRKIKKKTENTFISKSKTKQNKIQKHKIKGKQ